MSLGARLVLLHLGTTGGLLVVLAFVSAARHCWEVLTARLRTGAAVPHPAAAAGQVTLVPEPRVVDLRGPRQPQVAGAARGSS